MLLQLRCFAEIPLAVARPLLCSFAVTGAIPPPPPGTKAQATAAASVGGGGGGVGVNAVKSTQKVSISTVLYLGTYSAVLCYWFT